LPCSTPPAYLDPNELITQKFCTISVFRRCVNAIYVLVGF